MEGVGGLMLNLRIDFMVFLWKSESGSSCAERREKEDRPDLTIGQVYGFRTGLTRHLNAKTASNKQ